MVIALPEPEVIAAPAAPRAVPATPVKPVEPARTRRSLRLLPQAGVVALAVTAYFLVRGATNSDPGTAVRNAHRLVDLERVIGLYHEPGLQQALAHAAGVRTVLNWVYIWGHWPVIVVSLIWLARRHPDMFRRTRNAMMASGAVGLVVFVTFPVAPPRLAGLGMADTVTQTSHSYRVLQPTFFTNQYAALPSLHVGWNLLIGMALVLTVRHTVVRVLAVLMPAAMVVAVVLTANHYIVDVFAGAALTTAFWFLLGAAREPGRHRMTPRYRSALLRLRPQRQVAG